ncbi:glycosyltransferase family 4 protein [Dethiosulfatarculus sandiegensis]|uniref:Glycosyltransferase subfamily 4-like N-terminal domain-containing protein n=1 Tax=Dethiosulfatarculus sandiegensis TaxID=1429043 RepID=A0A0D2GL47_9BACT|nr:hypothetical protein X474_03825 [Dethiosulfatarculus sandiegensis]
MSAKPQNPVKVLLWHWGRRGGGPNYTHELAAALAGRKEIEVHLSLSRQSECFDRSMKLGLPGFQVDTYHGIASCLWATRRLPSLRNQMKNYLEQHKIDVVYCTMTHLWNLSMLDVIHEAGAGYLLTLHDAIFHPGERSRIRQMLLTKEISQAQSIITLTSHVKKQLTDIYGYPSEQTNIVPHGPFSHGGDLIRSHPYPKGPFNILFFGRILPYKGLDLLISAYELIKKRFPEARLHIIGKGNLPINTDRLRELGVLLKNHWVPENEVNSIFAKADLLVTPYVESSQSGVIPLAYAKGLPVVATPVGGLTEQVADGFTGLISTRVNPRSFADAVCQIISSPKLYEKLAANALKMAKETIAWPRLASKVGKIITGMCQYGIETKCSPGKKAFSAKIYPKNTCSHL